MRRRSYTSAEVLGSNCRFLQGPGTSKRAVAELREAVRGDRPASVLLLNYRKGGAPFYNQLHLEPLFLGGGRAARYYVGMKYTKVLQRHARGRLATLVAAEDAGA